MQNQLKKEAQLIAGTLIVGLVLGLISQMVLLGLLVSLALYLARLLFQLSKIEGWLHTADPGKAPRTSGLAEYLVAHIYRLLRRKDLEIQTLQKRLDQQTNLIADLRDGVLLTNSSHRVVWSNHQAHALLMAHQNKVLGMPLTHIIRSPQFHAYMEEANFDDPLRLKLGGRSPWIEISVTLYEGGESLFLLRDITHLQRLEQIRQDFIANLSHELKTPLTVLRGYLETLQTNNMASPSIMRVHQEMEKQTDRMSNLLKDLLLLSQLEDSRSTRVFHPVNVPRMLAGLVEDTKQLDLDKEHVFFTAIEDSLHLMGNEAELYSAFSNLITNARRHTPVGTTIRVLWYADDRGAHFVVEDNGPGIDKRHLHRLTERFYRVEASRSSATGGTGLGLAIVKHVLIRHRAELEIESELERGSRFSCNFPSDLIVRAESGSSSAVSR